MNDRFYNTLQPSLANANRGTQMVRETIGTQNQNPLILNYLNMYDRSPNKPDISSKLYSALQKQNVPLQSSAMEEMLRTAFSLGAVIDLEHIFAQKITAVDTHLGTRGIHDCD